MTRLLICLLCSLIGNYAFAKRPEVFFYPPGYQLHGGIWIPATLTNDAASATTDFPDIPEMAGIVVTIYWSRVCPTEFGCDFTLPDTVIDYWRKKGKKVVLSFPTIGHAARQDVRGGIGFETATPNWVLKQVATYRHAASALDLETNHTVVTSDFPDYADWRFLELERKFISTLGRFDGKSSVSQIRIAFGFQAEDNPSLDGLRWDTAADSDSKWIAYCRNIVEAFRRAFHQTRLEADIGRIPWIAVAGQSPDRVTADDLVRRMIAENIFLAFDGLSSLTPDALRQIQKKTGPAKTLEYLLLAKREGDQIGLESVAPLYTRAMADTSALIRVVREVNPDRLVLFGDAPAATHSSATWNREFHVPESLRQREIDSLTTILKSVKDQIGVASEPQ